MFMGILRNRCFSEDDGRLLSQQVATICAYLTPPPSILLSNRADDARLGALHDV